MTDGDHDAGERIRREASDLVLGLTSGAATRAEVEAAALWCHRSSAHREAFARASARWRDLDEPLRRLRRRASAAATAAPAATPGRASRRALLGGLLAASGAGVAVLAAGPALGLWPSMAELAADHRTAVGERRRIEFGDGIALDLNTRTSLNVLAPDAGASRFTLLAGETLVSTRSRRIEIDAAQGRVIADDAVFDLRHDGSAACVTCLAGAVTLAWRSRTVRIVENDQVLYDADTVQPMRRVAASTVASWRAGDLVFTDEPLATVIDELNRYRVGRIVLIDKALGRRRFTAHFKLDRLDDALHQFKATFGARVTVLPGGLVLVG